MVDSAKKPQGSKHRPLQPKFGDVLGSFCNVKAFANIGFEQILPSEFNMERFEKDPEYKEYIKNLFAVFASPQETGLKEELFTGAKYQCVEFARRFMIFNQQATFRDVDLAFNIFDIEDVQDIYDKTINLPFISIKNGELDQPPLKGDYVIFQQSQNQPYGHIAVVVESNINGAFYYDVAEQNYNKRYWPSPNYSRRLIMEKKNGKYYLTNKTIDHQYPKVLEHSDSEDSDEEGVIGIKRVNRPLKYIDKTSK